MMYTRRRQTVVCIELLVGLHVSFFVRMLFVEDIFYYPTTQVLQSAVRAPAGESYHFPEAGVSQQKV